MEPVIIEVANDSTTAWDVMTAIGTVGAVAVALILGLVEGRRRARDQRHELSRLERERDEARRTSELERRARERRDLEAQARSVVAFIDIDHLPDHLTVTILNGSTLPVTLVTIRKLHKTTPLTSEMVGQWKTPLLAGEKYTWPLDLGRAPEIIRFTDAHGNRWLRFIREGSLHLYDEYMNSDEQP